MQYGDTTAGSLMLIELSEAVPINKAVITVNEMLEHKWWSDGQSCNAAVCRGGAVGNVENEEELLRMLGQ